MSNASSAEGAIKFMYCLISSVRDRISGLDSIGALRLEGGAAKVMDGGFTFDRPIWVQDTRKQHANSRSYLGSVPDGRVWPESPCLTNSRGGR